jgi:23S rRNA pseudoU1915 N3-methylase RlmH
LKERVVEKKREEFADYAKQVATLATSYAPPDPAKLQQAYQQGNIKVNPAATPDQVLLVISNYLKPNDSMTITFDKAAKALQSVQIASYLDSASDVVKVQVQFAKLAHNGRRSQQAA